jgi:hypothetical protein
MNYWILLYFFTYFQNAVTQLEIMSYSCQKKKIYELRFAGDFLNMGGGSIG